jgi:hypothetical protein
MLNNIKMLKLSKSILNSSSNINCSNINTSNINCTYNFIVNKLTIGKILNDGYNYNNDPLTLTTQNPIISTTGVNDSVSVLDLCRQGTSSQSYGARASFNLSRHTISTTNANTLLELKLAHNSYDNNSIMIINSNGDATIKTITQTTIIKLISNGKINSGNDNNFIQISNVSNNLILQSENIIYFNIGTSTGSSFNVNSQELTLNNGNLITNGLVDFRAEFSASRLICYSRWIKVLRTFSFTNGYYYFTNTFEENLVVNKTYLVDVIVTLGNTLLSYKLTQIINNIGTNVLQKYIQIENINPSNIFWDTYLCRRLWIYVATSSQLASATAEITITSLG